MAKVFVKLKGDKVLMAGTGCESTRQTIELTQRMADLGADCASVITPHYFASQMAEATLLRFYQDVAGVKAAMDLAGYRGGDPRRPLRPLTDQ